jgi:hypothetical protein
MERGMRRLSAATFSSILALALTLGSRPLFAQGGPPLLTDDPDTPGPRHWEINLSLSSSRTATRRCCPPS